jgi:hypothetical protein
MWEFKKRIEVSLIRDGGFGRYLSRYSGGEAARFAFFPTLNPRPVPVGDVFPVDEWDLTGAWVDDGMAVYSYDYTVSQQERMFLICDLQNFFGDHSSDNPPDPNAQTARMFCLPENRASERPLCTWNTGFMMIFHGSRIYTPKSNSFADICDYIRNAIATKTHDVVLQFPWEECSGLGGACPCNSILSRSMHRPSLVWDVRYRKRCTSEGSTRSATQWIFQQFSHFSKGLPTATPWPPIFSCDFKGCKDRVVAIVRVLQHILGLGSYETLWILEKVIFHGALLVPTQLHRR